MSGDDTAEGGPKGGATEPPGGPKRPTQTIELQAEEVTVDEPDRTAAPQEEDADEKLQAEAEPEAETETGDGEAEAAAAPQAEERVRAYRAPQRTGKRELGAFFTHLAAGLVGGLIGVLAVGYGLDRLPFTNLLSDGQSAAPQAEQIAALETELSQVRALAQQAQQQSAAPDADKLQSRVANLENTLKSLGDNAADGSGGELAQAAALSSRITELGNKLEAEIASLNTQVDTLQTNAAQTNALRSEVTQISAEMKTLREQAASGAGAPQLGEQIETLGRRIAGLEQDVERAGKAARAGGDQARAAAFALAYANLERTVANGKAYAADMETVEKLAPAGADLTALKARADKGVPTVAQLQASFETHAGAAAKADKAGGQEGWLDKLLESAESVVTIRRTAPDAGAGTQAILARMGERVAKGDIAGAVQQGETLQGAPRQAMQPWLDEAQARLTALQSLDTLKTQLMTNLGAGTAPAQR